MHDYHSIIQAEKKADIGGGNNGKHPGIETCRMIWVSILGMARTGSGKPWEGG